jgi:hypothetical protein
MLHNLLEVVGVDQRMFTVQLVVMGDVVVLES